MSNIPENLKYTQSHEWIRKEADGSFTIGVTDHAQSQLGDFVFVDLPAEGDEVSKDDDCCVVESVKAASDVYAPLSGKIKAINGDLDATPGLVNEDPYGKGWLFSIEDADESEYDSLLDAKAYAELEE